VFARTSELSRLYTATTRARSLEALHVAAAHVTCCTRFVSGNDRQLAVAKASGLEVVELRRGVRGRRTP
jgi:hypothetical protein